MTRYDQRSRVLAVGLAAIAGYVDATGFLASQGFFVSFMSGNSTRLAVGAAARDVDAAAALALICIFVTGVLLGALAGRRAGVHQRPTVIGIVAGLLALAVLMAGVGQARAALGFMALAMGAENAVFEADGEVQIGLTYMTGTLVKLGQRLATTVSGGDRWGGAPYALLWLGLAAGALLGAAMFPRLGLSSLIGPAAVLAVLALLLRWPLPRVQTAG